jgi:hypothetical protein
VSIMPGELARMRRAFVMLEPELHVANGVVFFDGNRVEDSLSCTRTWGRREHCACEWCVLSLHSMARQALPYRACVFGEREEFSP